MIKYLEETAFFMPEMTRLLIIDFIKTFIVKGTKEGRILNSLFLPLTFLEIGMMHPTLGHSSLPVYLCYNGKCYEDLYMEC